MPRTVSGRARVVLRVVLGLVVLAAIALLASERPARRYFVETPASCNACHVKNRDELHATKHSKLECSSCHANQFGQNLRQWLSSRLSLSNVEHGRVDLTTCRKCHSAGTVEPWRLARTQGHVAHVLEAKKPLACSECHDLAKHRVTPKAEVCAKCHSEIALFDHTATEMPGGKPAPCLSCHEFLARTDIGKKTLATDCRRCHGGDAPQRDSRFATTIAGTTVRAGQIHGNLTTCSACHNPHVADPAARNLGTNCTRCHDAVTREHHAEKLPEKFDCASCHKVHGPRAELAASCRGCHEQAKESSETLAREHQRCTQCHTAHGFVATMSVCTTCHDKVATALSEWKAEKHADCSTCHRPHDATPETARCSQCHQKTNHGHPVCTTCHEPHQDAEHVAPCASCHRQQDATFQLASVTHRTKGCETCHQPHNRGAEIGACQSCHAAEKKQVVTARISEHQRCASCHQPHTFAASTAACTNCHAIPKSGPHSGACQNCHTVHGSPLGRAQSCSNCHQNVTHATGAHAECTSCHAKAHAPEAGTLPSCKNCHSGQALAVATWSPPKHQACNSCHATHQASTPAACPSCHSKLAGPVKAAGHRCSSCHETHAAKAPLALWTGCATCHTANAAAAKTASGPTHSQCKSCHEPHTAAAPACGSCHKTPGAGLHAAPEHQKKCTSCHTTHAPAHVNRAQCLTCHTQRANHFPEANSCASCHLFK